MIGDEKDDEVPTKPGLFSGLRDLASMLGGGADPQSIEDHPGMLPGHATIVADEGQTMAENSASVALQRETYIVDVHPDNGTDPAIRVELQCWVSWIDRPLVGDTVPAGYTPGAQEAVLLLAGHPRWDWRLAASNKEASDAVTRETILGSPPDTPTSTADDDPVWSPPPPKGP